MTQFKYLGTGNFVCTSNGERKKIRRGETFDANEEDVELFKTFSDLELIKEEKLEVKQPKKETVEEEEK